MIDALIAGKVYGQPQSRNDAKGNPYCFGKVRASTSSGESLFVSVIAFGEAARAFMALGDGDSVALARKHYPQSMGRQANRRAKAGAGYAGAAGLERLPSEEEAGCHRLNL